MPFALLLAGTVMLISAVRGTYPQLIELVSGEFKGTSAQSNFLFWIAAVMIVGIIGYVKTLENFSRVFLALIIVGLLLSNKGFFPQFFGSIGVSTNSQGSSGVNSV